MRNAFVVLVFLCIGLVSGFIVPSSVPEHTVRKSISNVDTNRGPKLRSTMIPTKHAVLPKNRSSIDEKDLYEHATDKKNNQSERAFVYINQKYKKPVYSKQIKMLPIEKHDLDNAVITSPATTITNAVQILHPSAFDSAPKYNSKFQEFSLVDSKQWHEVSPYFVAPDMFTFKFNEFKQMENNKFKMEVPTSNRVDERREYFELLKPPILRPSKNKVNFDKIHEIPSPLPPSIPYRDKGIKKYNLKNQYVAKAKETDARQNQMWENYGYTGAFIRRPVYQPKELTDRVNNVHFEENFINEDFSKRDSNNLENKQEDKLLDQFLKETFKETQFMNANDDVSSNLPECMKEDCISKPHKKIAKNNGLLIRPDCKCGRTPSLKQVDAFVSKDRSLREENDRNETPPKSSEVIFYEAMLSDEANVMKQDDTAISPPNEDYQTRSTLLQMLK